MSAWWRGRGLRPLAELIFNRVVTHIPLNRLRVWVLRRLGARLGPHTYLFGGSEVLAPEELTIDGQVHIGRFCQIDARGGIHIGRNVVIASHTLLITADHDPDATRRSPADWGRSPSATGPGSAAGRPCCGASPSARGPSCRRVPW